MSTEEYQKKYKQRGHTSEPPNRTLKEQYDVNKIISRSTEDKENKVTIKAVAYNLRVLFNKILKADETINLKNIVKYHIDDYMLEISQDFEDVKFKLVELKKIKKYYSRVKKHNLCQHSSYNKKILYLLYLQLISYPFLFPYIFGIFIY